MIDFSYFGLEKRDKRVYDSLLTNPKSSIRGIADSTGLNRGTVYESLKQLSTAGLVSYITTGKAVRYVAENPEKLHEIINEKRSLLLKAHDAVDQYISLLDLNRTEVRTPQFASFYEGDDGMASILKDVLLTCRLQKIQLYRAISSPRVSEYLYNNFRHYTRERIKNGIYVKVLRQGIGTQTDATLSEWYSLDDEPADNGCYTIIYGSKVAIISIDRYNHTNGIIIDNTSVSKIQEKLFDKIWEQSSKSTTKDIVKD